MAVQTDDARPLADLNDFRRDLLNLVAEMDSPHGLAIKEAIEMAYGKREINHGRLYPALDDLAEKGLVDKSERDNRTNEYEITKRGRRELQAHRNWFSGGGADE